MASGVQSSVCTRRKSLVRASQIKYSWYSTRLHYCDKAVHNVTCLQPAENYEVGMFERVVNTCDSVLSTSTTTRLYFRINILKHESSDM